MKPPKAALRYPIAIDAEAAFLQGHRRAEKDVNLHKRSVHRLRSIRNQQEELPRLIWRSPYFPFFENVPVKPPPPARKVWSFGKLSNIKSAKLGGRYVLCTSTPEKLVVLHCEYDDLVEFYTEQPFAIRYNLGDRVAWHSIDVFCLRAGRHIAIQAKTLEGAQAPEWRLREPWIKAALEQLGFEHDLRTDADLAVEPRLTNIARRLNDRLQPVPECAERVTRYLSECGPRPLWAVSTAVDVTFVDLRRLVAHRLITADIDERFDEEITLSC